MKEEVTRLEIILNRDQRAGYSAGETVTGHVLVELSALTNLKSIKLEINGIAQVSWNDGPQREYLCAPSFATVSSPNIQEEIECLSVTKIICEPTDPGGWVSLNPGCHEFDFQFELPMRTLASSFSGKYGIVRYWLTAALDQPPYPKQTISRDFSVIADVDVNTPELLCPVSKNEEKMIGAWIFTSGPISLRANIERRGYCNDESIPIYADIENCSSRLIIPKAVIYQTQTYLAHGKMRTCRQVVASVRGNHIPSGGSDTWNGKPLKIPLVCPSILNCDIIRVEYSLAVIIQIPGARKLRAELPIVIGTVPSTALGGGCSSIGSQFSMDMSWLTLALPDLPEAPPNYADVVSEAEFALHCPSYQCDDLHGQLGGLAFAYVQEFRFQPPPLYSEVDLHSPQDTD